MFMSKDDKVYLRMLRKAKPTYSGQVFKNLVQIMIGVQEETKIILERKTANF